MKTRDPKLNVTFSLSILLIALILIITASCGTIKPYNGEEIPITGMIYDLDNKPIHDVQVLIPGSAQTVTDINGHFTLPNLFHGKTQTIIFQKPEYETVTLDFVSNNPADVIYVKMASNIQLLAEAEKQIKAKNWQLATVALTKAEKIGCDQVELQYLRACLLNQKKDYVNAFEILRKLIQSGYDDPYIFLFAADLAQYQLNDLSSAKLYLKNFLDSRFDIDVQKRLTQLQGF